jgi:hypothetical protein
MRAGWYPFTLPPLAVMQGAPGAAAHVGQKTDRTGETGFAGR